MEAIPSSPLLQFDPKYLKNFVAFEELMRQRSTRSNLLHGLLVVYHLKDQLKVVSDIAFDAVD